MSDALVTTLILAATIALFAWDRLRLDVVAMLSLLALALSGVVTLPEAMAGFSSPAMLTIAGLFIVGAALSSTGVADWLGQRLERFAGAGEANVIVAVMGVTALVSALMSSTGTVAILLPVVGTLAQRRKIAPARLLMPFAFAAHLGSNLTSISTPPNVLVTDALRAAGHEPFRFFSFTGPGLIVLGLGVAYMAWLGRRALPGGGGASVLPTAPLGAADLARSYGLTSALCTMRISADSPLVGQSLVQADLRALYGATIIGLERPRGEAREACRVLPTTVLAAGDELRVLGDEEAVAQMQSELALTRQPTPDEFPLPLDESLTEFVLPRRSGLVGRSLREARFRHQHQVSVLAIRRTDGTTVRDARALRDAALRTGDTLLVKGRIKYLRGLRSERDDLVLVAEPDALPGAVVDPRGAVIAVIITAMMLLVMATGALPNVIAVFLACAALVVAGCLRPTEVYGSVSWESVVLIACMIPLATALETSGALGMVVSTLEGQLASASPRVVLALLVGVTSLMGMFLSNTATAVLVAPLAMRVAVATGIAPEPLLMGVAFACSAAFATPISSPVNVLVMGPGGYRFVDYVRVGLPLQLLVLVTTVLVVPLWWPF